MLRKSLPLFLVLCSCAFGLLVGCDPISDADDVKIPVIEPKLLLNAYLIPQRDTQQIFVATSFPVNYDMSDYYESVRDLPGSWRIVGKGVIPNATVRFTDLDHHVTIVPTYDAEKLAYIFRAADLSIREGGEYEVEVSYEGYPSIRERFVVPVGTKPEVECEDAGVATLVRILLPKEPLRYFCVSMAFEVKNGGFSVSTENTYFVSTATSLNGAVTLRRRSRLSLDDITSERIQKLIAVRLFELDERSYLYFTALEKNMRVQDNPFATPSLLRNYVKDGFGIAAGVIDYGEVYP